MSQMESFRKRGKDDSGGLVRQGSTERGRAGSVHESRSSWTIDDDLAHAYDNFRPVTLTVSSFFKQVSDVMSGCRMAE